MTNHFFIADTFTPPLLTCSTRSPALWCWPIVSTLAPETHPASQSTTRPASAFFSHQVLTIATVSSKENWYYLSLKQEFWTKFEIPPYSNAMVNVRWKLMILTSCDLINWNLIWLARVFFAMIEEAYFVVVHEWFMRNQRIQNLATCQCGSTVAVAT